MIPQLTDFGYLPEGIHDCSLPELEKRFGLFQVSDQRLRLFERLVLLIQETTSTDLVLEIIVNGSFVTAKDIPNDIDLIIALKPEVLFSDLPFSVANKLDVSRLKKKYRFDITVAVKDGLAYRKMLEFFQGIRDNQKMKKGVLRLKYD